MIKPLLTAVALLLCVVAFFKAGRKEEPDKPPAGTSAMMFLGIAVFVTVVSWISSSS